MGLLLYDQPESQILHLALPTQGNSSEMKTMMLPSLIFMLFALSLVSGSGNDAKHSSHRGHLNALNPPDRRDEHARYGLTDDQDLGEHYASKASCGNESESYSSD